MQLEEWEEIIKGMDDTFAYNDNAKAKKFYHGLSWELRTNSHMVKVVFNQDIEGLSIWKVSVLIGVFCMGQLPQAYNNWHNHGNGKAFIESIDLIRVMKICSECGHESTKTVIT